MKNIGEYKIETFPISRLATVDIGATGLKKHHAKALIELDVTEARKMIREKDKEFVFNTIRNIASKTRPILASFQDVLRFPGTDLFVLTLKDEERFRLLHEEIRKSGIKFKDNRFPYKPHCTLRSRTPITDYEIAEIMETKLLDEFIIDTISIYMVDKIPLDRLYTVKLLGE